MVVGEDSYTHIDHFSNPDVTHGGGATGSETSSCGHEYCAHNCASVLNETASEISQFEIPQDNVTLPGETVNSKEFRLSIANTSIATTSGQSYTVKSGSTVVLSAPTVTLKKGFKAEKGSHFYAPNTPEK